MPSYKLYGVDNREVRNDELQNKGMWCRLGESQEETFVRLNGSALGLTINPEKSTNKFAPDLLNTKTGLRGDLKVQNTPFFQARQRFGLDPQNAVVFNLKDRERYRSLYPEIEIYFAVDWQAIRIEFSSGARVEVAPMVGIWYAPFKELNSILDNAPVHSYVQRVNDNLGNAKGSYVIDVTRLQRVA